MNRILRSLAHAAFGAALLLAPAFAHEGHGHDEGMSGALAEPPHAFDQIKALVGEWIAAEDTPDWKKGDLVSRYELTGGGSAVMERIFPGAPYEMTTVFHRDGADLALTHYCAAGNQPHMRAKNPAPRATVLEFAFDGGTNLDPAKDAHMHSARLELLGPDELIGEWQSWSNGRPSGAPKRFHLLRRH